jgi:hypothetical protein
VAISMSRRQKGGVIVPAYKRMAIRELAGG